MGMVTFNLKEVVVSNGFGPGSIEEQKESQVFPVHI